MQVVADLLNRMHGIRKLASKEAGKGGPICQKVSCELQARANFRSLDARRKASPLIDVGFPVQLGPSPALGLDHHSEF